MKKNLPKILLGLLISDMSIFFIVKTLVLFEELESTPLTRGTEYSCFLIFIPLFWLINRSYVRNQKDKIEKSDNFLNSAAIISVADKYGKITFVNKKFEDVSGWKLEEVIGKDHSIVNSGTQPDGYWGKMYATVMNGEIWNDVVCNRDKSGNLYYVDTYIRARFDIYNNLEGFSSIRQDVTELKRKEVEIRNRMNAINKSNAVIEFDLEGNIIFANDLFLETLGYSSQDEIIGKHHKIFVDAAYEQSNEYHLFWEKLKSGTLFSGEITRVRKDGKLVYLQATYNPVIDTAGDVYRIMKIATDITESYEQNREIEKRS
jgi:methyl-accepting chemotaxis protein